MSRHTARARSGQDRTSLYAEITDKIIAELEGGRVPWVQPWGTAAAKAPLAMPKNATTQRRYSGVNVLLLWGAVIERGFVGQNWLTFRQALSLGGNIRKGEHGTTVVYADRFTPEDERRRAERDGDEPDAIPFLKRFTVFNTDQCENLPDGLVTAAPPVPEGLILPQAEALIDATGADFRIGGDRAFYTAATVAIGEARERDSRGRPLPSWQGCRVIAVGEVFFMNALSADSLDGRYFGPLPAASIFGRAAPLWTHRTAEEE
jgi:antirestriction protein ArdC